MNQPYQNTQPSPAEVEAFTGPTLLEFGDNFCGFCRRAQPAVAQALAARTDVRHLKIADGRGLPLGRAFGVKLWPTLVFLQDGREVTRLVRPTDAAPVSDALQQLAPARTD